MFENLENIVQWVDDNGVCIANDEPVIRQALLSELRYAGTLDQSDRSLRVSLTKTGRDLGNGQ